MERPALEQIATLTRILAGTRSIDKDTRTALLELRGEIARLLDLHEELSAPERLEALAVRFEADHPAVGSALRQAIDALGKAGV
jgi:hypothetical protein